MEFTLNKPEEIVLEKSTIQSLTCMICSKICFPPKMMVCCEQLLCEGCLDNYLIKSQTCPVCKTKNPTFTNPSNFIMRLFNNIKIKCPNEENGCNIKLNYNEVQIHIKNCEFKEKQVKCFSCLKDIPKLKDKINELEINSKILSEENSNLINEINFMKNKILELSKEMKNLEFKTQISQEYITDIKKSDSLSEQEIFSLIYHDHLSSLVKNRNFSCDSCGENCQKSDSYNCKQCDLDICLDCFDSAFRKNNPNKHYHAHSLETNLRKRNLPSCDICGRNVGKKITFFCSQCNFDVCWKCYWK